MPLQKLVGNIYSVVLEVFLWLIPIFGAVFGYFAVEMLVGGWRSPNGVQYFLGILVGIIAGLLLDVIALGPLVVLMNIRSSLKNIEAK